METKDRRVRWAEKKKAHGLCRICGKPRKTNKTYCDDCKLRIRKNANNALIKWREKARESGRCPKCGCPFVDPPFKCCINCREHNETIKMHITA